MGGGGLQVKIVSVHVLYFSFFSYVSQVMSVLSFFSLGQSGYVSLRWRDGTWSSTSSLDVEFYDEQRNANDVPDIPQIVGDCESDD